jgi:hypothetical protein
VKDPRDLYGLPLDRFIAERAALAKAMRSDGEREAAAQVAKLHKPSVAAWAVNQLVRTQRLEVAELFEAGDQLQRAQSELLEGRGDGQSLRDAAERERAAVELLSHTARGLLTSQGHELSSAVLERVRETLHAAALDQDARAQVADGCLVRELRHVGIGGGGTQHLPGGTSRSRRASAPKRDTPDRSAHKQAARERTAQLKALRKTASDARRAAERAARDLRVAQERRDRAADALEAAEAALTAASERVEKAARDERAAQQALD